MHTLEIRKTHKYVGTCSDMDEWETIGHFRIIASGTELLDEEDPCDPQETTLFLNVNADGDIPQALQDSLTRAGCHHEFDCCGCVSTVVTGVEHLKDNLWKVVQHHSRNF